MRAADMNKKMMQEVTEFKPDIVFVCLGGNDIDADSSPKTIVKDIKKLIDELISVGVKRVLVSEVLERGNFTKAPGLTKTSFDAQRKSINQTMKRKLKNNFVPFPEIHFPVDYTSDLVHFNESGLLKQFHRVKRALMANV